MLFLEEIELLDAAVDVVSWFVLAQSQGSAVKSNVDIPGSFHESVG